MVTTVREEDQRQKKVVIQHEDLNEWRNHFLNLKTARITVRSINSGVLRADQSDFAASNEDANSDRTESWNYSRTGMVAGVEINSNSRKGGLGATDANSLWTIRVLVEDRLGVGFAAEYDAYDAIEGRHREEGCRAGVRARINGDEHSKKSCPGCCSKNVELANEIKDDGQEVDATQGRLDREDRGTGETRRVAENLEDARISEGSEAETESSETKWDDEMQENKKAWELAVESGVV
ncbi:hypothetical protein AHAS_Ahas17G0084300 [Arachis hypogaea]